MLVLTAGVSFYNAAKTGASAELVCDCSLVTGAFAGLQRRNFERKKKGVKSEIVH